MLPIRMENSPIQWINSDLSHYSCDSCIETQKRKKETKRQNTKTRHENKMRKTAKKQNPFLFFLQNEKQSGSGDVVSQSKQKTFLVANKKCFGNGLPRRHRLDRLKKNFFFIFQ